MKTKLIPLLLIAAASLAAAAEISTHARFVPERSDDFAWENDKVAFRAYGPALRDGAENSGIDCWLKRVDYPIVDKWYKGHIEGVSYHEDHGEGLDNYHVGSSAGTGGTGIWIDGRREPLETFVDFSVDETETRRTQFTLRYEREIDGVTYGEIKAVTIALGDRYFTADSVFTKDGEPAAGLLVCVGVTTHEGKAETASHRGDERTWVAAWEAYDGSELGTGVRMASDQVESVEVVESETPDEGHILIIARTDDNGRIRYQAGYGWKKAGEITTFDEWKSYLATAE